MKVQENKTRGPFSAADAPDEYFNSNLRFMPELDGKKPRECDDAKRSRNNQTAS